MSALAVFAVPKLRRFVLPMALCAAAGAAQAGVVVAFGWDEAFNGDLSNDGLAPTWVNLQLFGSTDVIGTTGRAVPGGPVDRDYFRFTVPVGFQLNSMVLLGNTVVLGDVSFLGLMAGPQFTVPPDAPSAAGMLGFALYGNSDIGNDLLYGMSFPLLGSSGFSLPLPAGTYSMWVQETSVGTARYGLQFNVSAVPEPATALSLLAGLGLLAAATRRRG